MPEVLEERGGHLPHRDYIAAVVTGLEETGRGPDGWELWEENNTAGDPVLWAQLAWGAGSHDPRDHPEAPDSVLLLTVNWSGTGGWSYGWDNECLIDGDGPQVFLDTPADADPATVVGLLEHAMTNQDDPARWTGSERLYEAVLDIWRASN